MGNYSMINTDQGKWGLSCAVSGGSPYTLLIKDNGKFTNYVHLPICDPE